MRTLLENLARITPGGYEPGGPVATEPTAWAAIALAKAGRAEDARRAADWLKSQQAADGSVSAIADSPEPNWTTSLAVLAWQAVDAQRYQEPIQRGARWLLQAKGTASPRSEHVGHDTTLIGWSWAAATHSWLEPTAFAVMALRAAGQGTHPRCREGVRLLIDRLLPTGGCNYGNTMILGQTLVPHLQPSGIVAWALAGEGNDDPRIGTTLHYLEREIERPTGCVSLAFALIALAACGRRPENADTLIHKATTRPATANNTHRIALLALAAKTK